MSHTLEETEPKNEGPELSLLEHLNELRIRLTKAFLGLLATTIISFVFAQPLLKFLLLPYEATGLEIPGLQTLRPTEGVETFFKVALLCGVILAMPVILYQLWQFIAPGLTPAERKYIYVFIPSALFLFFLGIAFAWFVLLPAAILFLANFLPDIFVTQWTGQEYIGFVVSMLFWLGVSFELPVIVYFIARVGIVEAKVLREQWRVAVVAISVLAAIITPSIDPVTMLLTMAPLIVLYILSFFLAYIGQKQFERTLLE